MSQKYQVRKCRCSTRCPGPAWVAIDPSGYITYWPTWKRAMLRATKEW